MGQRLEHLQKLEPIHGDSESGTALIAATRDEDALLVGR